MEEVKLTPAAASSSFSVWGPLLALHGDSIHGLITPIIESGPQISSCLWLLATPPIYGPAASFCVVFPQKCSEQFLNCSGRSSVGVLKKSDLFRAH